MHDWIFLFLRAGEKDEMRVMRWLRELTKPNVVHLNSSMQAAADLLNREQNVFMAFVKVKRSFDSFHIIFSG
jgi:hypothetical protein